MRLARNNNCVLRIPASSPDLPKNRDTQTFLKEVPMPGTVPMDAKS